jgi:hypothetical protein
MTPPKPRRPEGPFEDFLAPAQAQLIAPDGTIHEVGAGDRITARFEGGRYSELIVRHKTAWPPFCDSCSARLTEPGAVVLTPPMATGLCRKLHLCVSCFEGMFRGLDP